MNNPDKPNTSYHPYPPTPDGSDPVLTQAHKNIIGYRPDRDLSRDARHASQFASEQHLKRNIETNGRLLAAMVFVLALSMDEPAAAFLVILALVLAYVGETFRMHTTALVGCLCFMALAIGTIALRWYL